MSSFCKCKSYSHFFSKNINVYAIINDQSFNDTLTNDIISFEQLGPDFFYAPAIFNVWGGGGGWGGGWGWEGTVVVVHIRSASLRFFLYQRNNTLWIPPLTWSYGLIKRSLIHHNLFITLLLGSIDNPC